MTAFGNTLTVGLNVSFPAGFAGAKNVYGFAQAYAGLNSGWQTLGSWSALPPVPRVLSLSPSSGSGSSATFAFTFSDPAGALDIGMVQMLFNSTFSGAPACYVTVFPGAGTVYVFNDSGTALIGPVTLGGAGTVQNSQCTVNASRSNMTAFGNILTVGLNVSFPAGFAGAKTLLFCSSLRRAELGVANAW